jgi:hypothetical protein
MKAPACQHNTRRLIRAITQSRDIRRKASSQLFAKALCILFVGRIGLRLGFADTATRPTTFAAPGGRREFTTSQFLCDNLLNFAIASFDNSLLA